MSDRQAAHVGSTTAHGGAVTKGFDKVLINGNAAARMDDPVDCSTHGPGTIASGNATVLVGGKPLARFLEPVKCVPSAPGVEPLVDHGTPRAVVGKYELYADAAGDAVELPERELEELLDAVKRQDARAAYDAWRRLPASAKSFVTKFKVVDRSDPRYPNAWREYELSGPAATVHGSPWFPLDASKSEDGWSVKAGGTAQLFGVKASEIQRVRREDGAIVEDVAHGGLSLGVGGAVEVRGGKSGVGGSVDGFGAGGSFGAGGGRRVVSPATAEGPPPGPAPNTVVAGTSADVLVGS